MVMDHLENEFRKMGKPGAGKVIAGLREELSEQLRTQFGTDDIPFPSIATPVAEKEKLQEYRPFTNEEERALKEDGAHFIDLTGETIEGEQEAGRLFRYITNGGDRLLKLPSIKTRVAIYPDLKRFFIANSGNKDLQTQEKLAKKDGEELRARLGLKDDSLDVIIPDQASTLTELTFKYLDETGVWLFGEEYASVQGLSWVYGRTKNPVNKSGSHVASVGRASPDGGGVFVSVWDVDGGSVDLLVVRLVVAKKK